MAVTNQNIFKQILEQLEGNGRMDETKGLFGGLFDLEDQEEDTRYSSSSGCHNLDQPEVDFDEQSKNVEVVEATTEDDHRIQFIENEEIMHSEISDLIGEFDAKKAIIYSEIINPKYF